MRLACISVTFFLCVAATSPCFAGQAGAGTASDVDEAAKMAIQRWTKCLGQAAMYGPIGNSDAVIADRAFAFCQASELEMDRASAVVYQGAGRAQGAKDDLMKFKAEVRLRLLKEIPKIRANDARTTAAENAHRRWVNCFEDKTRDSTTSVKTTIESGFSACSSEEASFAALASDDPTERAKVVKAVRDKARRDLEHLLSGW